MNKENKDNMEILTTRQFADMCKVEKRTLYYYEEIGLLNPIEIKENGYRMYSTRQFDTMSMIKALQSVGMPLSDIKDLMDEHDLNHCKHVLSNQIHLLKEKQKELKSAEQILSQTTEQIENYLNIGSNVFFTEKISDIYLVTQEIHEKGAVFVNYITNGYSQGVIMNESETSIPQYIFKRAATKNVSNAVKHAGTYACIYQSIPSGKIAENINSFVNLLYSKQLATEGPLYMESIANDFIKFPNDEYIFKLSVRCKE